MAALRSPESDLFADRPRESADRPRESADRPWESLGPTWVEVDLDVLAANFAEIAAFVRRPLPDWAARYAKTHGLRPPAGPPKILVVVKANAYGHGAVETARAAVAAGADWLGVSTLAEALELRRAGITVPILTFDPLTPAEAGLVAEAGVTATVTDLAAGASLSRAAQAHGFGAARDRGSESAGAHGSSELLPVHISVDTGMSRYGVGPAAAGDFAARVAAMPGLALEGLYTHFSTGAEYGPATVARMRQQLGRFVEAAAAVEARGLVVPLRHVACSSAVLQLPEGYLDMVRVGNLFYGFSGAPAGSPPRVRQAWRMVTRVLEVREVPPGTGVGYGPDVTVKRRTRLATVPAGYADGVGAEIRSTTFRPRARLALALQSLLYAMDRNGLLLGPLARLVGRARSRCVFAHEGRPVNIVGRISMQQTILDVTARPEIRVGSLVTVRVPRVLASPRVGRVYRSGGRVTVARTSFGTFDFSASVGVADSAARAAAAAREEAAAASAGRLRLRSPGGHRPHPEPGRNGRLREEA